LAEKYKNGKRAVMHHVDFSLFALIKTRFLKLKNINKRRRNKG